MPVFNLIGKELGINLTIAYDKGLEKGNCNLMAAQRNFSVIAYEKRTLFTSFFRITDLNKLINGYDVVIFSGDLHFIAPIVALLTRRRRPKVYLWGIGLSSAKGLREKPLGDRIRYLLNDLSDGTILYSSYVADIYRKRVFKPGKVFVAHNSILVRKFPLSQEKKTKILSIGTFKKNKRLPDLVIVFAKIIDRIPEDITLDFIGDGEDANLLRQLADQKKISGRVNFWGRMEDDEEIYAIMKNAIVSVSPTQAGLSVLHAMAMGCPFLTSVDAITGGERFNIKDNETGYYYNGQISDLEQKLIKIVNDQEDNRRVAYNAYTLYHEERNVEQMAKSFVDIIMQ